MTTVGNGYKLMVAENDGLSDESLPLFQCGQDFSCLSEVHRKFFQIGMDKSKTHEGFAETYTNSTGGGEATFSWDDVPYIFTTNDGVTYGFLARGNSFEIVVDVNGDKGPNKVCEDLFRLGYSKGTIWDKDEVSGEDLCPSLDNIDLSGGGGSGCSPANITGCTSNAELASIVASATDNGEGSKPFIKVSDDTCLFIWPDNQSYGGDGNCDCGGGEYYICGGQAIGDGYCYAYKNSGEDEFTYCN